MYIRIYRLSYILNRMLTFSWQWDKTLGTSKAIITRARKINYAQFDQLGVVIEDSRWQLLYLVVTQFPNKKRYSMISAKSVTFFEIVAIPGYFVFKFPVGLTVCLCRAWSNTCFCFNVDKFAVSWYLSTLLAKLRRF